MLLASLHLLLAKVCSIVQRVRNISGEIHSSPISQNLFSRVIALFLFYFSFGFKGMFLEIDFFSAYTKCHNISLQTVRPRKHFQ